MLITIINKNYKVNFENLRFLFFILCLVQPILFLKLFSLVFIILPKNRIQIFKDKAIQFYLIILLISIIHGILYLNRNNYIYAYLLNILFWVLPLLAIIQIKYFIWKRDTNDLEKIFNTIFVVNLVFCIIQYIEQCVKYMTLNPYSVHDAVGDYIVGIFGNANVNMIILAIFTIYFFYNNKYIFSFLALIFALMTTFNGGTIILTLAILYSIFFGSNISIKQRFIFLLIILFGLIFIYTFSYNNLKYSLGFISRSFILNDYTPLKLVSFIYTIKEWTLNFKNFFIGEGPANFSSRVAFLVSGEYVSWWPDHLIYISDNFRRVNLNLWLFGENNAFTNVNSFANQPNMVYAQIIGEYGLIGLLLFLFLYLKRWIIVNNKFNRLLTIFFIGILFTDYWFEFFNVIVIFELIMLYGQKKYSF